MGPSFQSSFLSFCLEGKMDGYFLPVNAVRIVWREGGGSRGEAGQ
jgi:hypothetical protein